MRASIATEKCSFSTGHYLVLHLEGDDVPQPAWSDQVGQYFRVPSACYPRNPDTGTEDHAAMEHFLNKLVRKINKE